jgi:membrane protein involved in colicin uptake
VHNAAIASSPQVASSPIAASAAPLVAVATPRNNVPDKPEVDEDAAFAQRMVAEAAAVEAKRAAEAAAREAAAAAKADDALAALRTQAAPASPAASTSKPADSRADMLADLFGDGRPAAVTPSKQGTMNRSLARQTTATTCSVP